MRRRVFVALIFGYAVLAHRFCRPLLSTLPTSRAFAVALPASVNNIQ